MNTNYIYFVANRVKPSSQIWSSGLDFRFVNINKNFLLADMKYRQTATNYFFEVSESPTQIVQFPKEEC